MTDDEWSGVCWMLENSFQGDFDDDKRAAYKFVLADYPAEEVLVSIRKLILSGNKFLPVPGEILPSVIDSMTPPVPDWSTVWNDIRRIMSKATRKLPRRVGIKEALAWAGENVHPAVLAFVEIQDLDRLLMVEFYDPEYGRLRIAELERHWNDYVGTAMERVRRGRALHSVRRRELGPESFDWVGALKQTADALRTDEVLPQGLPSGE